MRLRHNIQRGQGVSSAEKFHDAIIFALLGLVFCAYLSTIFCE
jgi:hypothetical protein